MLYVITYHVFKLRPNGQMAITQVSTNVVIVGAGPAGLGCAALLKQMGINDNDMFVIDAKTIGSSFKNWPKEMKMITPSFPSNGFHQTSKILWRLISLHLMVQHHFLIFA